MEPCTIVRNVPAPPPRAVDGHKGTFGTVIVVGGCPTMIGAPALAAGAALRGGAGLVRIASLPTVLAAALTVEPCATGIALDAQHPSGNLERLHEADPMRQAVLAIGPGLGAADWGRRIVDHALDGRRTTVLDADGLNLLARLHRPRPEGGPPLVLTPHPGEFARLAQPLGIFDSPTDENQRPRAAAMLAVQHRAVVVLKGRGTVVSDGQQTYINTTGNPALATAGSGDVLTGLVAALLAQGLGPFDAAVLGVYLHGLAGDLWQQQFGPVGLTARELLGLIPQAMEQHRRMVS